MERNKQFESANRRAKARQAGSPHAVEAFYDRRARRIVVRLSNRIDIAFSPSDAEGLETAMPLQLAEIEISPSGFGLHFPRLDADLYLPALLEGMLGSQRWMASRLGAKGGKVRSAAKARAARKNGKLGGRPKKKIASVA